MSENLRRYQSAIYALDAVIRRVPDDAWDAPSPCEDWTAREVVGHVLWGINSLAAGEPQPQQPEAEIAGDDVVATWTAAIDRLFAALDTKGALQRTTQTPFGELPVDATLGFFFGDPVMHTWDLAQAAGIEHGIRDDLAEATIAALGQAGDALRGPGRLGPLVQPPADADAAGRMAAFGGRTPMR